MRALLATGAAAALLTAGCGPGPASPRPRDAHVHRRPATTAPAFTSVGRHEACRRLLADITRNRGVPDIATLAYIAGHSADRRIAREARTAALDLGHTGHAEFALALLREDCAKTGVRIPFVS